VLVVKQEWDNCHDKLAVAVIKDAMYNCWPCTCKNVWTIDGNVAFCEITGERCNCGAGFGVEIPNFYGRRMHVVKLKELLTGFVYLPLHEIQCIDTPVVLCC